MSSRHLNRNLENELVLVGAADDAALPRAIQRVLDFIAQAPFSELRDVALTAGSESRKHPARVAIIANTLDDLQSKLKHVHDKLNGRPGRPIREKKGIYYSNQRMAREGKLAFVFPGEGSQYPDMLRDLCVHFPECRSAFDDVDAACSLSDDGFVPSRWIFPEDHTGDTENEATETLFGMAGAVEAVVAANTAFVRLFSKLGIRAEAVLGHSSGEYAALEYADVLHYDSPEDRIHTIHDGYEIMKDLQHATGIPEGALLAVGAIEPEVIEAVLKKHEGNLLMAMENCRHQYVLCAKPEMADLIANDLINEGGIVAPLPFTRPYHTEWYRPGLGIMRDFFSRRTLHAPRVPVYTCLDGGLLSHDIETLREQCVEQWASPVRFQSAIRQMYDDGYRIFVELGARGNLTAFIGEILRGQPHLAVASNRIHRSGVLQLHHALGALASQGLDLDIAPLHAYRGSRLLDFDRPPAAPKAARSIKLVTDIPIIRDIDSPFELLQATPLPAAVPADRHPIPAPVTTPPAMPPASPQETAMLQYMATMETFLQTQHAILSTATGLSTMPPSVPVGAPVASVAPARLWTDADLPMLAGMQIVQETAGESIELLQTFTLDAYPFLCDHTLGTAEVSMEDPRLMAMPIMPLTGSLETMAETARRLVGMDRVVVQLQDIQAYRWISFEESAHTINILAQRIPWETPGIEAVKVRIRDHLPGNNGGFMPPMVETTVLLAGAYAGPEAARPITLQGERQVNWEGEEIYPERLFHGPLMQGIERVERWGENGMVSRLVALPRNHLIRDIPAPRFSVDPIFLDAMGASLGVWRAPEKFGGFVLLPFRIRRIRFLLPPPADNTHYTAHLRIGGCTDFSFQADTQVLNTEGQLAYDMHGWEDRAFHITEPLHRMFLKPADSYTSYDVSWPDLQSGDHPVSCSVTSGFPEGLFEGSHEVWHKMLGYLTLWPSERDQWKTLPGSTSRRIEWLLGRASAKDAVRRYLKQTHGQRWAAPDVRITADALRKPHVEGAWQRGLEEHLDITISHTTGFAAAATVPNARVGIDVERADRDLTADFTNGAFSRSEHDLAAKSSDGLLAMLRFWCAKEALVKALGTGIRYSPSDLKVRSLDRDTGRLEVEITGQWLEEFPAYTGRHLPVHTHVYQGAVLGICVLPPSEGEG